MVALRTGPKGRVLAPFGLCTLAFALLPVPVGTQDLSALFSYRAEAAQQPTALASPFGTIHLATYSFPRPVGTAIPRLAEYRLASLDPGVLGGGIPGSDDVRERSGASRHDFPKVNRWRKGDSLLPPVSTVSPRAAEAMSPPSVPEPRIAVAPAVEPALAAEAGLRLDDLNADAPPEDSVWPELDAADLLPSDTATMDTAGLYFGTDPLEAARESVARPPADPGSARSNLEWAHVEEEPADVAVPLPAPRPADGGKTIAAKGEVTGSDQRPMSLAQRLGLGAKARAKAEKCLADAVYFEARGESVRGQIAVAQVVMNRVFSEFYPGNVCSVVYQNAHRHLACQFTFACDGIPEVVNDANAWRRAERIAKDTLDGKLWLDDIGKATHYHANWVRPWWIRTMRKLHRIGVHTFYRPRRWGDGSDEPMWGSAAATADVVKRL